MTEIFSENVMETGRGPISFIFRIILGHQYQLGDFLLKAKSARFSSRSLKGHPCGKLKAGVDLP